MSAGPVVSGAGLATAGTTETFAVALVGEEDRGWLVDAESAADAWRIVHGTVPRAHEVWQFNSSCGTRATIARATSVAVRSPTPGLA